MATLKIQRAIKEIGVNGGNISKAMRKVGYAPSTAARTDKLTRRKGFKELLEKELPESNLLKVHKEGLKATRIIFTPEGEMIKTEDYATRHKYLETGYKVRGRLKGDEPTNTTNVFINNLTIEQQRRLAQEIISSPEESAGEPHSIPNSNQS